MIYRNRYILLLIGYAALFVLVMLSMPRQVNWSPSFSQLHKIPYGCYILYNELPKFFPESEIGSFVRPLYNSLENESYTDASLIAINQVIQMDALDLERLMDFVDRGNDAMLISERFSQRLLDTLGLEFSSQWRTGSVIELQNSQRDWLESKLSLEVKPDKTWPEQRDFAVTFFELDSTDHAVQALGWIDSFGVNFLRVPFGDGIFYLNTSPYMFTNFNILQGDNHEYSSYCLSYLKTSTVIWDEYYKLGRTPYDQSPLSTLLKNQSARFGIYLALIGLLLYLIFHVKRRQRIIPVLKPFRNSSLDFVETLGDLYFEQGNHQDLAEKKILYLKDFLHEQYRMSNITFDQSEIPFVSAKSGHPEELISGLYQLINRVESGQKITVQILERLTEKLQIFYHRIEHHGRKRNI